MTTKYSSTVFIRLMMIFFQISKREGQCLDLLVFLLFTIVRVWNHLAGMTYVRKSEWAENSDELRTFKNIIHHQIFQSCAFEDIHIDVSPFLFPSGYLSRSELVWCLEIAFQRNQITYLPCSHLHMVSLLESISFLFLSGLVWILCKIFVHPRFQSFHWRKNLRKWAPSANDSIKRRIRLHIKKNYAFFHRCCPYVCRWIQQLIRFLVAEKKPFLGSHTTVFLVEELRISIPSWCVLIMKTKTS